MGPARTAFKGRARAPHRSCSGRGDGVASFALVGAWHVYMVRCRDGSLYTGVSNDVDARVARHNAGKGAAYTRARRPVVLVWKRRVRGRSAALKAEAALKRLTRAEKLELAGQRRRAKRRS